MSANVESPQSSQARSWEELTDSASFIARHLGPSAADRSAMLDRLGLSSVDELIQQALPASIVTKRPLALGSPMSEHDALAALRAMADENELSTSLIGVGYHDTITPPVILRNVLENPAWYTAYTPYQPEISQGRLEALLNFQTMVIELTGLDVANASMLDEATAAAEAMTLCRRQCRTDADTFVVDADVHPQTLAVIRGRAEPLGIKVREVDFAVSEVAAVPLDDAFGVLVQYPSSTGRVMGAAAVEELAQRTHAVGALFVMAADPLALVALTPPGDLGADVAVGSTQRFGVPMGFGGPHAAYMAVRELYVRSLPGRLVGVSVDSARRPALRLALQTREQHIRREKATSNICTAQVLLAVMAGLYATYHGPEGLARIAERVWRLTGATAVALRSAGFELVHDTFFDTLAVRTERAQDIVAEAESAGLDLRLIDESSVGFSFNETSGATTALAVLAAFGVVDLTSDDLALASAPSSLPEGSRRVGPALRHPIFSAHHTEHAMLRYLRSLADKDLALDRTMIPLGSCTMKLNATAEMIPITWPQFSSLHPFAPARRTQGYLRLVRDLEAQLAEITGYDAVSVQPNAGSQGELAGLLAIRGYHLSRGDRGRTVCLIPSSAHGTNAASAVMAGMQVVVVACDTNGNVDLDDLRTKVTAAGDRLSAVMVTYPSTHGVFEEGISELCRIVHEAGGQVYVDGANLNALVGLARPGEFGADVSHLNLHKTFCIPHGGGGPGVGPVGVRSHLAPFLPGHHEAQEAAVAGRDEAPVSAAPFGSAAILPISWMYITMMGATGLRDATATAILAANYLADALNDSFPVLYRGAHDRVAHECILDLRPLTKATGVTVDDVAKRLMDYGFHAPTMSFPVAGTLMVEPTESEPLVELDRFIAAMQSIRAEIGEIESGAIAVGDSPLRHAPHPATDVLGAGWDRAYPPARGAALTGAALATKYWPPVGRIDGAAGDRNLVCACPPVEAFVD